MATTNSVLFFQTVSNLGTGALTTITILSADGVPGAYHLTYGGWSPQVSKRKQNLLSGSVSYEPVEDEMTLDIKGATPSDATHNLQVLIHMLDQADRWYDNQWIAPVRIWYQPKGSTLALNYNTLVLGNRSSDDWAQLPVTYDEVGSTYWIRGVVIKFLRAGVWYQSDTANTAATSAVQSGVLGSLTLPGPNSDLPSPCDLTFGSFVTSTEPQPIPASVLLIANNNKPAAKPQIVAIAAKDLNNAGVYTSVNDSAKNAVNTNVLRYTPATTTYTFTLSKTMAATDIVGTIFAIYATVRNNSTTTTFKIKVGLAGAGTAGSTAATRVFTQEAFIDASIQTPRVVFLGTVTRPVLDQFYLNVSIQASAASGSIDIDNIVLASIDDESVSIIEIVSVDITNEFGSGTRNFYFWANQGSYDYVNPYKSQTPTRATFILGAGAQPYIPIPVTGLMPIMVRDATVKFIWLCIAAAAADRWVYVNNSNNPKTATLTISARHSVYLIPE